MIANEPNYKTFDITVVPSEGACYYSVVTIEHNKSFGEVEIEWDESDPEFPKEHWCENQMRLQGLEFEWSDFDDYGMNF